MGIAAIAALLLPSLPALINMAEKTFVKPDSGTTKLGVVLASLRVVANALTASGGAPSPTNPPVNITDDHLVGLIEATLAEMKSKGTLGDPAAPSGQLYLLQGSITPLNIVGK